MHDEEFKLGNPLWEYEVIQSSDGITICAKVKKGTRVKLIYSKAYGTIRGAGMWKGRLAYHIWLDGQLDCNIVYPEEFEVLEGQI